jgi:hypothetical protein
MDYQENIRRRFDGLYSPEPMSGCWLWLGPLSTGGYGNVSITLGPNQNAKVIAHRLAYELFHGPIPIGMCIDHLCRCKACVNPDHLEAVTPAENVRRGKTGVLRIPKTACCRGHVYTAENSYMKWSSQKKKHYRFCKVCCHLRYLDSGPRPSRRKSKYDASL